MIIMKLEVLINSIFQIGRESIICHPCWMRADRAAVHLTCGPSTSRSGQQHQKKSASSPPEVLVSSPVWSLPQSPDRLPLEPAEEVIEQPEIEPRHEIEQPAPQHVIEQPAPQHVIEQPTIVLPDYIRAKDTENKCFIEGCLQRERNRVPLATRKMLLDKYNYYIPKNNRVCDIHLAHDWDFLNGLIENYMNVFTANQIQDMLLLKSFF